VLKYHYLLFSNITILNPIFENEMPNQQAKSFIDVAVFQNG